MEIVKKHTDVIHYYKIFIRGLPHTRNYGISKAIGNIIIFCNDDVIIHPNFIKNHIKNYEDKEIWGVGGRIINVGNQYRYSNIVNTEDTVKKFITNHGIRRIGRVWWWDANLIYNFDATIRTYVDHVQGCNISYRKEALIEGGGFYERFGGSAHLEESDLCMRIRRAGHKIVPDPLQCLSI